MFHQTRLKLTVWYLVILMSISILFSGVIYGIVSNQIQGLIHRQNEQIKHFQDDQQELNYSPRGHNEPPMIPVEELEDQERQLLLTLIGVNGVIFIMAGGAAYFLAGRTLRPIKYMIDEQNQFISSSSHQLRTPIATMRAEMETSLLEKNISDKKARELTQSHLEELESLQLLTNNLLKLARIHNLNPIRQKENISIAEIIDTAAKKVQSLAKKKRIGIHRNVKEAIIQGEKTSLVETFVILLENAIKYSKDRTDITIDVEKSQRIVIITIRDQGIGITKEDLPHIFDRFYRADKSYSHEGFGLGLSIAKKTIEIHNGSIQVNSTLGEGTTFTISLPLFNATL